MHHPIRRLALLSAIYAMACADDVALETETQSTGESDTSGTTGPTDGTSTTGDADESSSSGGEELPPSSDWCDRVIAGPPGRGAPIVELSLAHARIRFFGTEADYPTVDAALATVLQPMDALDVLDLGPYDDALASVCILPPGEGAIGAASVEMMGSTAWVRPGTGTIELPAEAQVVVLDLRDLPNVPELRDVLEAAVLATVAPTLDLPLPRTTRRVRRHWGHTDQTVSESNAYYTEVAQPPPPPLEPEGSADHELVVVTGERLAPAAAELAGWLRLQERAWLVGHDVLATVAESSWSPIGDVGAAWHSSHLLEFDTISWPDVTVADVLTNAPEDVIAAQFPAGPPPPATVVGIARPDIEPYDPWTTQYSDTLGLGEIRSALVVVHGVLELFFPYFGVVGHETDEMLLDLLAQVDPADVDDRASMVERVRRLSAVLDDASSRVSDLVAPPLQGVISARFEALDGYPVVRRTNNPGLQAGDTIIEIEGEPTLDWYAARHPLVSAATDGGRHDRVTLLLTQREDPIELTIESAQGMVQSLLVEPVDIATADALGVASSDRSHGWLDDLGAPGLYYLNLGTGTTADTDAAIDAAIDGGATGMVVDARVIAVDNFYSVAMRLVLAQPFYSPRYDVPHYTGPDVYVEDVVVYDFNPVMPYAGPMVLILGNHSCRREEVLGIVFRETDRATVVGQPSCGSGSNPTGIKLPGGFAVTFSGSRQTSADGSLLHGVGILPDVEVPIDPVAYAQGDDPELLVAIDVLTP
jgi:hypothetical protein